MDLPSASLTSSVSLDVPALSISSSPSPPQRAAVAAILPPEKVASAIVNVLVQRGVVVKVYLERAQVEELNARNLARLRDREQQTGKKEPKFKPERMPPKPREGDWWDAEIYLDEWTAHNITDLHRVLDPTVLHQDTIVWHKECISERNQRPAWRYCFEAAPPLSLSELRDKVHRMYTFAYEVERPAVGKKLEELRSRVLRMEKIVYYDAEGLLGEERYELEKEGQWEDTEDKKEEEGGQGEKEDEEQHGTEARPPPTEQEKERRILFRQEARLRLLEEKAVQIDELIKQVMSLQASVKELSVKMDSAQATSPAAANGARKAPASTNLDPAQTQRDILRKKLEAKKRAQAEEQERKKAQQEDATANPADEDQQ